MGFEGGVGVGSLGWAAVWGQRAFQMRHLVTKYLVSINSLSTSMCLCVSVCMSKYSSKTTGWSHFKFGANMRLIQESVLI